MRSGEINEALSAVSHSVAAELSGAGWIVRNLGDHHPVTFSRSTQNGVLAVAELSWPVLQWPAGWPVSLRVKLGVGYEPALNLMPLLTLPPGATLVAQPASDSPAM